MNNPLIVFFGDSRAADWPPPDLPQFRFVNRGTGGQTSAEALMYFDAAFAGLHPQAVVLQIGVNDLSTLTFYPKQSQEIVATCQSNIEHLVKRLTALAAKIILTTIFPAGEADMFFYSPAELVNAIDQVNSHIHSLAAPNVVIFDAYTILASDDGLTLPEYTLDLLHINARGYEALNRELVKIVQDK